MSPLHDRMRSARLELGLTQSALADASGVSLATVQNVEAGRANPSLSTLTSLLAEVGLEVSLRAAAADWDALRGLGLPLAGPRRGLRRRDADALRREIGRAAQELATAGSRDDGRRSECLRALLLALDTHYPSVTRRWLASAPVVRSFLPTSPKGREIKLARIARARLAEYL